MTMLYIGGLPYSITNDELADAFRASSDIVSVEVRTDRMTGRSRGFGFVEFASEAEAQHAISMWHGKEFAGRTLTVNVARPLEERPQGMGRRTWHERAPSPPTDQESTAPQAMQDDGSPPLAEFLCDRPIIEVSNAVSLALMKYLLSHPTDLRSIDRRRFEELVAELWSGFGYSVELTQRTRDGGVDVIAIRKGIVEERYLIECKRPDLGNYVGIVPVRALYGVLASQRATKAILATTARFSKTAIVFFEDHKWQLEGKDYGGLMDWVNEYIRLKT